MSKIQHDSNLSINSTLLLIGTIMNKGLQFIMIPLFSRWLTTEEYGDFDVFSTYVSLMIPVVTLACSEAVFRFGIEKDGLIEKGKYIMNGLAIVTVNCSVMFFAILWLKLEKNWDLAIPFFFMALGEILNNYVQGYMRAVRKLKIYSFFTAFSTLFIFAASSLMILVMKMGLEGLIWGYALGFLIGDLSVIFFTGYKNYFNVKLIKFSGIKEIIKYSFVLIPNNICWWIINVSDRSIINSFLGPAYNGVYAIACKIPNLATAIFSVFSISWQQSASDMVDSNERNEYYNRILNKMCYVLIPLCSCIIASNFILFNFIFDRRYYDASLYTPILVSSVIFYTLSQFFGGIQISLKHPIANTITTVIGAIVNLLIHLLLVNGIGLFAAVISTISANVVITFFRVVLLRKYVSFSLDRYVYCYIIIYLYFVIMSYVDLPFMINCLNLIIAMTFFVIVNKDLAFKIVRKIIKHK